MSRIVPALALWLLGRLAHRNEPLAGDLVEQFRAGRSMAWLWSQLLIAIAMGSFRQPRTPVALNLTPIDPIVAEWLMSRRLPRRRVNLSSPVEGVGGLGMMIMGLLLSTVVPDVWWFVMGGIVCGLALGMTLAYRRRHKPMATDGRIHTGQLKDLFA
jgi:MFS family permease